MAIDPITIITQIKSGKHGRDKALSFLYNDQKLRDDVNRIVMMGGGDRDDFLPVFHETLMQFVKTVIGRSDLTIKGSLVGYIVGIARYVWLKNVKGKSSGRTEQLSPQDVSIELQQETLIITEENNKLINDLLDKIGQKCREVLMHWAHNYKMKEIAKMMNYGSEDMAKKKKYQCMKKLLLYVDQNPHVKDLLR